ncbi:hypothetical protein M9Y10_026678 [Tritrichomonas musculus]|uniref:BTB domain-containing protein n=1 Tax=Tritrichomonas musculus TaxID=1915356 RepID=A0ABR2H697_9EUKA
MDKVKLKFSSIFKIPFQVYKQDFTFLVNGKEFKTYQVISDLISSKISQIHLNDPTFDTFTINTQSQGDFSHILNLVKFDEISINDNESDFFYEVMEQLGHDNFEINKVEENIEYTVDNVLPLLLKKIKKHKKHSNEIEFISSHLSEVISKHCKEIFELDASTLSDILNHPKLRVKDEDEILKLVNEIYRRESSYSFLYGSVIFENVTIDSMAEFLTIFDYNDLDIGVWKSISARLEKKIYKEIKQNERYKKRAKITDFIHKENDEFNGIVKYLTDKTGGNIHDNGTISITASSFGKSNPPQNLVNLNQSNYYLTKNGQESDNYHLFGSLKAFKASNQSKNKVLFLRYTIRVVI